MRMGGTVDDIMVRVALFRMAAFAVMAAFVTVRMATSPHGLFGHLSYQSGAAPHRGCSQSNNATQQRDQAGLTRVLVLMMIVVMMHYMPPCYG
jgi:hypothetical protein